MGCSVFYLPLLPSLLGAAPPPWHNICKPCVSYVQTYWFEDAIWDASQSTSALL